MTAIILFDSFADGTYTDESDYDLYLVVDDGCNVSDVTGTEQVQSSASGRDTAPVLPTAGDVPEEHPQG